MNVVVIGASGNLGTRVVDELLGRGHHVLGIARNPARIHERPGLIVRGADAADSDKLAALLTGHDAIITAIRFFGFKTEALIEGLRKSGVKRVLVSGSAGSLFTEPDVQLIETPAMSEFAKPEALDSREAFKLLRKVDDLDWTYLAPAALLTPGRRLGVFKLGEDFLIKDRLGESRISMEDLAIAIVDEIENPQYIRKRFTAAYAVRES